MAEEAGFSTTSTEPKHTIVSAKSSEKVPDEADTCRICRGEGNVDEPLFYPCKCSGSIKFVHQECLMEWLSHSQKKYCELCKTSFRFTKLYHPGMPKRIPTSVFIRRATIHVLRMFMTWCRALLVASVWLVFLPWCMRVVWRSLFWVGDGGWHGDLHGASSEPEVHSGTVQPWDLDTVRTAIASAKAANASVSLPLPSLLMPFSRALNISASENKVWALTRRFFFGMAYPLRDFQGAIDGNDTIPNATVVGLGTRKPSLLSDVAFFNWFPSQTANGFLIDVLEGQIITLLVVVAFILIFLIREWVVQQQPVINMVALGNPAPGDAVREPEVVGHEEEVEDTHEDGEEATGPDEYDGVSSSAENPTRRAGNAADHEARNAASPIEDTREALLNILIESPDFPEYLRQAMREGSAQEVLDMIDGMPSDHQLKLKKNIAKLAAPVRSNQYTLHEEEASEASAGTETGENVEAEAGPSKTHAFPKRTSSLPHTPSQGQSGAATEPPSPQLRPNMPARDRSFLATDVRRSLEEGNTWSFDNVSEIAESGSPSQCNTNIPESWEHEVDGSPLTSTTEGRKLDQEQDSENSSESWQQVPDIAAEDEIISVEETESLRSKGKAKATDESQAQPTLGIQDASSRQQDMSSHDITVDHPLADGTRGDIDPARDGCESSEHEDSERGDSVQGLQGNTELNPEPAHPTARPHPRLVDRVLDWLYGDIAPSGEAVEEEANVEHIVQDLEDEPPFVPFAANEPRDPVNPPIQDPEVAAAAAQAGIDLNDQDAIDEAEDLEGIMELIGMQGHLMGLFQNALFSAVLISATLACAVWVPYLWGKVVLLVMGSPVAIFVKLPLQFIAGFADFIVDSALCLVGGAVFWCVQLTRILTRVCTWGSLSEYLDRPFLLASESARGVAENALDRLGKLAVASVLVPRPDYFRLSINSHAALRTIQNATSSAFNQTTGAITTFLESIPEDAGPGSALQFLKQIILTIWGRTGSLLQSAVATGAWLWSSKPYQITFNTDIGQIPSIAHTDAEHWSAADRTIAVLAGYASFAVAGAFYVRRTSPFSTSQQGRKVEGIIADVLQQAGGVLKVILIISIEMLVFPLYCGLLLDVALLPLFRDATLHTRWNFARKSPWTSGFVHWFVGTCYMFHFALFVSMCRRIMRKGVLYFIRDPDDPTFHPVRDVLERSVTTQLRKIAFSALVYGALVIVCLGGVVWSLNRVTSGILPIHWTSHAPSVEFPLDLLFYNFLTPLIIKLFKPSDALHTIYQWWFKRCARMLRLSNFLFGEKAKDEEGHHVRRTWTSWLIGDKGDPEKPVIGDDRRILAEDRGAKVYFLFDGKYVRAPASDQVRIPRGEKVFVEVDQFDHRKDKKDDEAGVHNDSDLVTMVYIPPWFRVRIGLFVFTIWIFAAITGISITVGPLLFGRFLFSLILPPDVEMNDIHAFSLGAYTLGSMAYGIYHLYKLACAFPIHLTSPISTLWTVTKSVSKFAFRVLSFLYVWTGLVFIIPFLFALLLELYFLMPLHTYFGPQGPHVIHLIQDWTLGFLYARLAARVIFSNRASRPGRAFRAVTANGYLNPNARLATRCFLLPVIAIFAIAVSVPSLLAFTLNRTIWLAASSETKSQVWRFSYPLLGLALLAVWASSEGVSMLNRWRMVVRDEVYLIGERLHNFGEKKAPPPTGRASAKTKVE